jgi:hypothetical protein
MPMKLSTTLGHIGDIPNCMNVKVVKEFYEYLREIGTSENYQNQNIKQIIGFAKFLGPDTAFHCVSKKGDIISFLDTKIKDSNADPDRKWITTWNDYLWRIKYVGVLLISSLIVIPNITAMILGKGFKKTLLMSISIAVISAIRGILISYILNLAPGGTIVIVSVGIFLAVMSARYSRKAIKGEIERHRKQVNMIDR